MYVPSSGRLCGEASKKNLTYLLHYCHWFPHHPLPYQEEESHTEEGPGFNLALKQLQGISQAKAYLEWELSHEVGIDLGSIRTDESGWLRSMRSGESRWPKRWTLPWRSSSLRQAQPTWPRCCPGVSPLQPTLAWFPFAT